MKTKLEEVTEKICELLKGSELDPMSIKNGCVVKIHYCGSATTNGIVYNYTTRGGLFNIASSSLNWRVQDVNACDIVGSPIREAEVLMALPDGYAIDSVGEFVIYIESCNCDMSQYNDSGVLWELGKTLQEQGSETTEFLHKILYHDML